ncbi:hypothetical protein GJAV_G00139380 [Gymnothorax javanicus]|nr:hypothetical protein GJAV_G00139380 [Gymnothorax javanicus]
MLKKRYTAEEILKLLEEDAESLQCPADSSSDDEDLVHQANKTFKEQLAMEMLQFAEDSAATPPPPATCMPMFCPSEEESRIRKHCKRFNDAGIPRVTAFIGANIVTAQVIWEGLWMNCVTQSTGQMQCKIYDSLLALPQDLQAARALVVIAIIVALFGVVLAIIGGKCTNFVENEVSKAKVAIAAGITFIVAGVLILVPVCWSAHSIIRDFYNPLVIQAQRRELGAALYIGWGTAGLLILGGGLLCSSCPPKEDKPYDVKYSHARSAVSSRAYV